MTVGYTPSQEVSVEEITLTCNDGIELAAQRWTNRRTIKTITDPLQETPRATSRILCLHGYMDNCRSFRILAPRLVSGFARQHDQALGDVELVAIDFPSHGKSSHKSPDHPPMMVLSDFVYYVAETVRILKWNTFILIGHSMGSIVAIQYAAAFPQQIQSLVLLDGYGPEPEQQPGNTVTDRLKQHILLRYNNNDDDTPRRTQKMYPSIAAATKTRMKTARNCPGNQWISEMAAKELVERALVPKQDTTRPGRGGGSSTYFMFRHDPRLVTVGPILLHTIEHVDEYWKVLAAKVPKTIWLRAEFGWPFDQALIQQAENLLFADRTNNNVVEILPGSHHFHADPDTAEQVASAILKHLLHP